MKQLHIFLPFLVLIVLLGCARAPIKKAEEALRRADTPTLIDDLSLEPLIASVRAEITFLTTQPNAPSSYRFGPEVFTKEEFLTSLKLFVELFEKNPNKEDFLRAIEDSFDFYEVYGRNNWGEVFITSYFAPHIKGYSKPTGVYDTPLYRLPDDLLTLDVKLFDSKYENNRIFRARIDSPSPEKKNLIPYFSRAEIDEKGALKDRNLEICYVDPIDAFFLQVQGSGSVDLTVFTPQKSTGKKKKNPLVTQKIIHVNYADKNGQAYEAIGQKIKDKIAPNPLNLHTIEAYLRTLPRNELQSILNLNPSYVFFKETSESALTSMGLQATDGRTIATDQRFFPKGAIAFLSFKDESNTLSVSRLVLDQDIGGAITGPGRVDLFAGRGAEAKQFAGLIKHPGKLHYLVPKRR